LQPRSSGKALMAHVEDVGMVWRHEFLASTQFKVYTASQVEFSSRFCARQQADGHGVAAVSFYGYSGKI